MFHKISTGRVIAWDLASYSPLTSQLHSLIRHKNGAQNDKVFIIVIKKMELPVLAEIDLFSGKKKEIITRTRL